MSILKWILKPKKRMAKPNTKPVKIGKYKVTAHAQNRVVDKNRKLKKSDMLQNLLGKSVETKPYKHKNEVQYDRIHTKTKTVTHISVNNVVKTIHRVHNPQKEIEKHKRRR